MVSKVAGQAREACLLLSPIQARGCLRAWMPAPTMQRWVFEIALFESRHDYLDNFSYQNTMMMMKNWQLRKRVRQRDPMHARRHEPPFGRILPAPSLNDSFMRKYLAALLIAVAPHAFAADHCSQFSPQGISPVVVNARMAAKTRLLCYSDFEVLHSGITHGPLWSAEHLTRAHLQAARDEVRTNRFFEESRLPDGEGARLADYRKSGYDRGNMSPAGDRWNDEAMAESFSLANMVPQNPANNRQQWARVEEAVRRIGMRADDTYVVTGPMFKGAELKTIGATGVIVPTQVFKVVYVPTRRLAFAVVIDNTASGRYQIATVHELEAQSGLRFPGIPESLKDTRIGGLNGV